MIVAIPTDALPQQEVKLSKEEVLRYSRHLIMPEVGLEGQRQVTFSTDDVGKHKTEAAKARLSRLNPTIEIKAFETQLTSENAFELFRDFDIIVDGTDNFPTRFLVNDACVLLGKPNVYGSIFRF